MSERFPFTCTRFRPSLAGDTSHSKLWSTTARKRVQKILPSGTTNYVHDVFGRLIAEYTTNPTEAPCWTCYLTYDHLGSVRMVTRGNLQFIARHATRNGIAYPTTAGPGSAGAATTLTIQIFSSGTIPQLLTYIAAPPGFQHPYSATLSLSNQPVIYEGAACQALKFKPHGAVWRRFSIHSK